MTARLTLYAVLGAAFTADVLRDIRRPPVERGAVRCSCGQQCANRTALGAHTWSAHDRWPTDAERVIIAEQVAA